MLTVNNLIFRVEGSDEMPYNELEQVGNPNLKIWIKDYDVALMMKMISSIQLIMLRKLRRK